MMKNINETIDEIKKLDSELANQVKQYVRFHGNGLGFDRSNPEVVRLWNKKPEVCDKVHILPPRGKFDIPENYEIWRVSNIVDDRVSLKYEKDEKIIREENIENIVPVVDSTDVIYPGLKVIDKVERGDKDVPYHMLINAENYHALQMLRYAYAGKVDCIYIDPPYNTGAKDWKYNNNYVGEDDKYRHSKWLTMMERRLRLAKDLLNPADSVMIVTIDEKEYLRLGMLLEQMFPEAKIQMVDSVINHASIARDNEFNRNNEFIYFVMFGNYRIQPIENSKTVGNGSSISWETLRRHNVRNTRNSAPMQFYPIFVNVSTGFIDSIGDPLPLGTSVNDGPQKDGCISVYPIRDNGLEMIWGCRPEELRRRFNNGYVKAGTYFPKKPQKYSILYLTSGVIDDIQNHKVVITGKNSDGSVIGHYLLGRSVLSKTIWDNNSYDAKYYGNNLSLLFYPDRSFPYPKSLYAVEDCLRLFVSNKPNALIVDFFAGSGTTAHATMLLNHLDGGHRKCISVTNNEIGPDNEKQFTKQELRPTDKEWQSKGIANYITWERIKAAITGIATNGEPIKGDYKFTEEFPMSDGFKENAVFCELTYENRWKVRRDKAFRAIAPILWAMSGCKGKIIYKTSKKYVITDNYAVLFQYDVINEFVNELKSKKDIQCIFVVLNDDIRFLEIRSELSLLFGKNISIYRLYQSYLDNFEIIAEGGLD